MARLFPAPALLLGLVLTAACPPWDKPGSSQDTNDSGTSDDSNAALGGNNPAPGSFVGTSVPNGSTAADAGIGSGSGTAGGGSGSMSATPTGAGAAAGSGAGSTGAGGAAGSGAGSTGAAAGPGAGGGGIGGDGSGADPLSGTSGTGSTGTDPNDLPLDDGTGGAGGNGRTVGMGQFGGSTGTGAAMDDPNAPPAARLSKWSGRWNGTFTYYVVVQDGTSILTGRPEFKQVPQTMPMAMRVDAIDYDPTTAYATITARVAAGDCLLTSDLTGTIFFGDDLSPVSSPILALQAAGANKTGQYLAMRANATRVFNVIEGSLSFQGVDMLPLPCANPSMPMPRAFRLDRLLPTPN